MMMRTATFFAAVVLFAAALLFAAPAAAQEVYSAPCGEESVWRFYPGTPTGSDMHQYDFAVSSEPASNMLGLRVEQHDMGALSTPLSIPVRPAFVTGSAWLRTARWVDVRVTCQGQGTVNLNVTRLTPVAVRWVSNEGTVTPPSTEPVVITGEDACASQAGWNGHFRVPGLPWNRSGRRISIPASDSLYEIEVFSLRPLPHVGPGGISEGSAAGFSLYIEEDGLGLISERFERPLRRLWRRQTGDGRPPFAAVNLRTGVRYRLEVHCPYEYPPNTLLVRVTRSEQASNLRRVQ